MNKLKFWKNWSTNTTLNVLSVFIHLCTVAQVVLYLISPSPMGIFWMTFNGSMSVWNVYQRWDFTRSQQEFEEQMKEYEEMRERLLKLNDDDLLKN